MQDLQNLPERDKAELQNFIRNETQKASIQQSKNIPSRCLAVPLPMVPTLCPFLTLFNALYTLIKATLKSPPTDDRLYKKMD